MDSIKRSREDLNLKLRIRFRSGPQIRANSGPIRIRANSCEFEPASLIVASSLVTDPNCRGYCGVKVRDGHCTYSEGETSVNVCMGNFTLPHVCIVMETSALQVFLGMNFIRQNAKTILGLIFTPWRLITKNPETDELSLVSLSEKSFQKEGGNGLPPAQASLKFSWRQAYSLLPSLREQVFIDLGDFRPTVDLYTNPKKSYRTIVLHPPQFILCLRLARLSVMLG